MLPLEYVNSLPIPQHNQEILDNIPLVKFKSLLSNDITADKLKKIAIKGFDHFGCPCVNGSLYP